MSTQNFFNWLKEKTLDQDMYTTPVQINFNKR